MMKHWSLAHLHVPEDVRGGGAALGAAADVHGLALRGHRGPGCDDGGAGPHQHRHVHLSQDTLYTLLQNLVCPGPGYIENSYVCLTSSLITTEMGRTCYQTPDMNQNLDILAESEG